MTTTKTMFGKTGIEYNGYFIYSGHSCVNSIEISTGHTFITHTTERAIQIIERHELAMFCKKQGGEELRAA